MKKALIIIAVVVVVLTGLVFAGIKSGAINVTSNTAGKSGFETYTENVK